MEKFDACKFLDLWTQVLAAYVGERNLRAYGHGMPEDAIMRVSENDLNVKRICDLASFLEEHDLRFSASRARLIEKQMTEGIHFTEYFANLGNLHGRIIDELKDRTLLIIPSTKRELYQQTSPLFGTDVASKFPTSASWEIEEAGKCLALRRDTASVFHLMRAMEVTLGALGRCLRLQAPIKSQDKAWGTILTNYKKELDARKNPQCPRQWASKADEDLFSELHASLDAVKEAWRNKTMHVERVYTTEQAEHVFAVVKGFMQKVASRLDEDGQPLA